MPQETFSAGKARPIKYEARFDRPLIQHDQAGICRQCSGAGGKSVEISGHAYWENCACSREDLIRRNTPKLFHGKGFGDFVPKDENQKTALAKMKDDVGGSFYLVGPSGRGKTHLACSQYQYLMRARPDRRYIVATEKQLVESIIASKWSDERKPAILTSDEVRKSQGLHVFVTEFGKLVPTHRACEELLDLIDAIYESNGAVGLTLATQVTIKEVINLYNANQQQYGSAIARRLQDGIALDRVLRL